MESAENRNKVYGALQETLKQDKARTNILKISELGLVEMTRKRTRENLVQQLCEPCPNCEGRGYVLSSESMAYKVLREIRKDLPRFCGRQIAISVNPRVAEVLLARAHKACVELGRELGREIEIRGQPGLHQEQFEVTALDTGPPVSIPLQWLGFPPEPGDERASTAELQIEADGPSSAAAPDDTTGPADTAADEPEPAPTPPGLEALREAAEEEMGESVTAPELAAADQPEPAPPESTPAAASSEQTSRESTPTEAALEAAPPEDGSTEEPVIAASAEATESEKRFEAPAPAVEMLDLEPKTPILPHPAEVEEK